MRKYQQPQSLVTRGLDKRVQVLTSHVDFIKGFFKKLNVTKTNCVKTTCISLISLTIAGLSLTGCGQKGDLYLPDTDSNQNTAQPLPHMPTEANSTEVNNDNSVADSQDY